MVDTDAIRGYIARRRTTQEKTAQACGITTKTFCLKMKKGVFLTDEVEKMIDYLDIEDPVAIFFAKEVASQATKEKTCTNTTSA